MVGGRPCGSRYNTRLGRWDVLRDRLATRRKSCDTARSDTRGGATIQCATRPARPTTRLMLGLQHGTLHASTRCPACDVRVAWAQCARPMHPCWFRVCTWCTQPSFGRSALFMSHCLGPLFMNTVHKIFQKKKKKIKSNGIKYFKMKFSKIKFFCYI